MGRVSQSKDRWKSACTVVLLFSALATTLPAQTFTTLANFDKGNGAQPGSLVQGTDGNFYGTTSQGPASNNRPCNVENLGCGTVFKITPEGTLTTLHIFNGADGWLPNGLVLGADGNLYGTTVLGGDKNSGTLFKITPAGTLNTLHSFSGADGAAPNGTLIQLADGEFYGTTSTGGVNNGGTIFKLTSGAGVTTLYSFTETDGWGPLAGLIQTTDGNFYGTTSQGGTYNYGAIFEYTPEGMLTSLQSFDYFSDGAAPSASLIQATNRNLYGSTPQGGIYGDYGTIFEITPGGSLTTLHTFNDFQLAEDGASPAAALVQATDGNLYGTTTSTIFKIAPDGKLTTLYNFDCPCAPAGGLVQDTDGNFYGTTFYGGSSGEGTVFSLSVGLGPFVKTLPASGRVGSTVSLLGTNLSGATTVSFEGTAAAFTVVSPSLITTNVPIGAASGKVQVMTPGGVLLSNVAFRVRP